MGFGQWFITWVVHYVGGSLRGWFITWVGDLPASILLTITTAVCQSQFDAWSKGPKGLSPNHQGRWQIAGDGVRPIDDQSTVVDPWAFEANASPPVF